MGQSYRELTPWQKAVWDFVMDVYRNTKVFSRG